MWPFKRDKKIYFAICTSCGKRQRLSSLKDVILAKFVKTHSLHRIYIESVDRIGKDLLAYDTEIGLYDKEFSKCKPLMDIPSLEAKQALEIRDLKGELQRVKLALFDLQSHFSPSLEEREKFQEAIFPVFIELLEQGNQIAMREGVVWTPEQQTELALAKMKRILSVDKDVREILEEPD
jgi:hypothetical protein